MLDSARIPPPPASANDAACGGLSAPATLAKSHRHPVPLVSPTARPKLSFGILAGGQNLRILPPCTRRLHAVSAASPGPAGKAPSARAGIRASARAPEPAHASISPGALSSNDGEGVCLPYGEGILGGLRSAATHSFRILGRPESAPCRGSQRFAKATPVEGIRRQSANATPVRGIRAPASNATPVSECYAGQGIRAPVANATPVRGSVCRSALPTWQMPRRRRRPGRQSRHF